MPPWLLRPSVPKLIWLCARLSETENVNHGGSSQGTPERASRPFLPESPGLPKAQSMLSSPRLSEFPGEGKPALIIYRLFVWSSPVGIVWGVAEYTQAQIPGH
ncbi:ATPase, H+ transporting, V0 subunit E isoform 2, isoform CRA_a [Rattus norvegicus]|uniref:ATPase, H+ transporting, V0 subunit E isoform 2, isoform CRA_a n=1 Tax=Rattus norvegicus TaxID=10116 RepID=A6K0F6_RAT|nr:ATPase, H+ transporting, V0 subunit E isoform 2, isoform CRA_a [Rattus norvegicus]EDL88263.1 ATPase, H+ transporting, V0 subunit E isoform 2, isoform CRA_a [Rattus norvegicus]